MSQGVSCIAENASNSAHTAAVCWLISAMSQHMQLALKVDNVNIHTTA